MLRVVLPLLPLAAAAPRLAFDGSITLTDSLRINDGGVLLLDDALDLRPVLPPPCSAAAVGSVVRRRSDNALVACVAALGRHGWDLVVPRCGDGVRSLAEACDDGNERNKDGCSSSCEVEPYWLCGGGGPTGRDYCKRPDLHVDATQKSTMQLAGADVQTITDAAGHKGRTMSPSGGTISVVESDDGMEMLEFATGGSAVLDLDEGGLFFHHSTVFTAIMVFEQDSDRPQPTRVLFGQGGSSANEWVRVVLPASGCVGIETSSSLDTVNCLDAPVAFGRDRRVVLGVRFDRRQVMQPQSVTVRMMSDLGTFETSFDSADVDGLAMTDEAFTIGGHSTSSDIFDGYLGEALFFDDWLTDGALEGIMDTLKAKWNIGDYRTLPDQVDGLRYWVSADQFRSGDDGATSYTLEDRSGNGFEYSVSSGPPVTSDTSGRPCLDATGGADITVTLGAEAPIAADADEFTVAILAAPTSPGTATLFYYGGASPTDHKYVSLTTSGGSYYINTDSNSFVEVTPQTFDDGKTNLFIFSVSRRSAQVYHTGFDGSRTLARGASHRPDLSNVAMEAEELQISPVGPFYEMLIYDRALTPAEQRRILSYFLDKWAVGEDA